MKNLNLFSATTAACIALTMLAVSCSKEQSLPSIEGNVSNVVKLSNVDAQKAFAKILSKAVSESRDVRSFIKSEALAQFDNDYDVFYPFVKDKVVADGKTFRDVLLSYCDEEEELVQIEESSLLLNILVPDLTLFWDFDAEKWNIDGDEIAVISSDDDTNTLYEAGEDIGSLPSDEMPGFPCLVVKNNERMVVSNGATRAAGAVYEFAHDAYNPAKTETLTRSGVWDADLEKVPEIYPYAKSTELDPLVISAYNEFKTLDNRTYQRDNVYYGITKNNPVGTLRAYVQEEILMFRLSKNLYKTISDDDKDPTLTAKFGPDKGHGAWSNERIISEIWKEGNFEFIFKIFVTNGINSQPSEIEKRISVSARELFALSKIHVDYKNGTWFRKRKWTYTTNSKFLEPRWVKVGPGTGLPGASPVYLPPWELYNGSSVRYIGVFEADAKGQEEKMFSWTNEFSDTFNTSGEINIEKKQGGMVKGGIKVGYGTTTKETKHISKKTTVEVGSDLLGDVDFRYNDPIIISDSDKSVKGYLMKAISTGQVEVVFAPRRK